MSLPDNDHLLFQLIAEGDEQAFTALFNLYLPRLYPFIVKLTKSEPAVQEIIQETFIKVWLNRDKLAGMENPGGWLFRVASNQCYDYLRKRALNDQLFTALTTDTAITSAPHEGADAKELKRLVGEAVQLLPAQRQKIYLMSREQGKTIPEIARELQLSPNTVKNTLVVSLQFIRDYLVKHGITFFLSELFLFP
ncbi:RNA polymerase sigma-70 factor [Pseudoflavitalea sp. X16]|uniref:RNA polymerase sigma factor n=1 Tax=Paraflavitalea devenefica TaxID=2716334 RepID=UPI00141DDEC3|nr:RNA polymerase sigma-70 factor [Paraflavitalea devenefica]NII26087.1 RNA polymerase sigma-70 factor [Paraflavitalea devenefica]